MKKANFQKGKKKDGGKDSEELIIIGKNASFAVREAYKTLRTNVLFSLPASDAGKLIGVTSTLKGEGKSTNSINLALSIAELGKKTLLLDCDLRLSKMGGRLDIPPSPGLSNVLAGFEKVENVVRSLPGTDLKIITSGDMPPNPAELLDSAGMEKLCRSLSENFDYIITDLPPVGMVSDALIVSKYMDGMVLVVRKDYSDTLSVKDSVSQLNFVQAKILGFVFSDNAEKKRYGYGRRYGKYGDRYYKYDDGSYSKISGGGGRRTRINGKTPEGSDKLTDAGDRHRRRET